MIDEILTTFDEKKNEIVTCGHTEGDTFFRNIKMEHFMLKFWGFGIQQVVLNKLIKMGIKNIVLRTKKKPFLSTRYMQ